MPPPVTPSDEEPIAAGVRQAFADNLKLNLSQLQTTLLPPPVTPSDEEPIATGGRLLCA